MQLANGRIVEIHPHPMGSGVKEVLMADGGEMSSAEWDEYCTKLTQGEEIANTPDLDVRNMEHLPPGVGASYLLCLKGKGNTLIAKQWKRKRPEPIPYRHVLIRFEKR